MGRRWSTGCAEQARQGGVPPGTSSRKSGRSSLQSGRAECGRSVAQVVLLQHTEMWGNLMQMCHTMAHRMLMEV